MVSRAKERLNLIFLCGRNTALVNELKSVCLPPRTRLFLFRILGLGFNVAPLEELKSVYLPTTLYSRLWPHASLPSFHPSVPLSLRPSCPLSLPAISLPPSLSHTHTDSLTLYPLPPDGVAGVCLHTGLHAAGLFLHAGIYIFTVNLVRACGGVGRGVLPVHCELCPP